MRLPLALLIALVVLTGCFPRNAPLEPRLRYVPQRQERGAKTSPFPPLSQEEAAEPWGREYLIGQAFGCDLDLYRAVTTYKRALLLLPTSAVERRREIEYKIALSYYLGHRFKDALCTVEETSLASARRDFPAYRDLLILLYECYIETDQETRAAIIAEQLEQADRTKLATSSALRRADFCALTLFRTQDADIDAFLKRYCSCQKSVPKAQTLNALLPGLGYLYVGQKQSAITAALLNGLFIFGAYQFFSRGYWPAGLFVGSLELGWYFGGIYGGGESAHLYNRRLYEGMVGPQLCQRRLFPTMMLRFTF